MQSVSVKTINKLYTIVSTLGVTALIVPATTLADNQPLPTSASPDGSYSIYQVKPVGSQCVNECMRRSQMHSVGFEGIQEQCTQECDLESLKSSGSDDYGESVKALSEIDDPRAVQPD